VGLNFMSVPSQPFNAVCVFHSAFREYSGRTRREVVLAMHADTNAHVAVSFSEWWAYQQKLHKAITGHELRDWDASGDEAASDFISYCLRQNMLVAGPKLPANAPSKPGLS